MDQKECDNCFEEVTKKIDQVVNVAKNAIVNMNYEHSKSLEERDKHSSEFFEAQEKKHKEYLELQDKRQNKRDNMLILILTLFGSVIGYSYYQQSSFQSDLEKKAYKNEVLRIDDAKKIRELGDKYYDARYVIKDGNEPDPTNYKMFVETLFERASRSAEIKKNNN